MIDFHNVSSVRPQRPAARQGVLACVAALLLATGCASSGSSPAEESADAPSSEKELDAAKFAVKEAEIELSTARLEAERRNEEAQTSLDVAQMTYAAAQQAMRAFEVERQVKIDEGRLSWDRAIGRATDSRLELQELDAMYAEEEFAEKTKELVLTRGRRQLEHAERALNIQERKFAQLTETELPARERDLKIALARAKSGHRVAQLKKEVSELSGRLAIDKAERELKEARKKLEQKEGDA